MCVRVTGIITKTLRNTPPPADRVSEHVRMHDCISVVNLWYFQSTVWTVWKLWPLTDLHLWLMNAVTKPRLNISHILQYLRNQYSGVDVFLSSHQSADCTNNIHNSVYDGNYGHDHGKYSKCFLFCISQRPKSVKLWQWCHLYSEDSKLWNTDVSRILCSSSLPWKRGINSLSLRVLCMSCNLWFSNADGQAIKGQMEWNMSFNPYDHIPGQILHLSDNTDQKKNAKNNAKILIKSSS